MTWSPLRQSLMQNPPDLTTVSLYVARLVAYPDLDIASYLHKVNDLAQDARDSIGMSSASNSKAKELAEFLYYTQNIRGNVDTYTDPRNSFLNEVIDRKKGIPITLSILYVAIAKRLGLKAEGVALPGHFIVGVDFDESVDYIDPFNGEKLTVRDCARLVRATTGFTGVFKPEWLNPASPKTVIIRLLNNLRINYINEQSWNEAASTLQLLREIDGDTQQYLRDEGIILLNQGEIRQAATLLEQYVQINPDQAENDKLRTLVTTSLQQWSRNN